MMTKLALSALLLAFSLSPLAQIIKYKYDSLGRVTFVEDAVNGNRDYDYDKNGNRTSVVIGTTSDTQVEGSESDIALPMRPEIPTEAKYVGPLSSYGGGYSFSWKASSKSTFYKITFKDSSTATFTGTTGSTAGTYPIYVAGCNQYLCSNGAATFTQNGQASSSSSSQPVRPAVPTNATYSTASGGGCSFSWNPVSGASYYTVTFSDSRTSTPTTNSGSITGAKPVSVTACVASLCSAAASFTANGQAVCTASVASPTNPTYSGPLSPYGGGYSFQWGAVTGATYYKVEFKDLSSNTYSTNSGSTAGTYPTYVYACNSSSCSTGVSFVKK
jgi:YD repeat-containing protein